MTCLNTLAILAPAKFENAGPRFDHDDFLEAGVCFILIPFVCMLFGLMPLLIDTPQRLASLLQESFAENIDASGNPGGNHTRSTPIPIRKLLPNFTGTDRND